MISNNLWQRAISLLKQEGPTSLARSTASFLRAESKTIGRAVYLRPQAKVHYWRYKRMYGEATPKSYNLINISPRDVNRLLVPHFWTRVSHYSSYIKSGNWDINTSSREVVISGIAEGISEEQLVPFENLELYNSAQKHYNENVDWEETELYRWLIENTDLLWWDYSSPEQIRKSLSKLDMLYDSMKTDGYATQDELTTKSFFQYLRTSPAIHEVAVNIGRDGQIIFDDGRHRFVIAKVLDLDQIPVRVLVRHEEWQKLRVEVQNATSIDQLSEKAKRHLEHPDMKQLVTEQLSENYHQ